MAPRGSSGRSFEVVWEQIQRVIAPGDTIRNWSRYSGYLGNDFTIHAVGASFIEVDSPGAATIQHVRREEFARVYERWDDYNEGIVLRSELRGITRFSTYVISILHHVLNGASSAASGASRVPTK